MCSLGLRLLVCLAIFASYSRAEAASVDLTLAQVPGTTVWDLVMTSLTPVGAVGVTVTTTLQTFTPVDGRIQGYPGSCALGSSAFCVPYLLLSFAPPILATSQTLLGYFNSSDPSDEALPLNRRLLLRRDGLRCNGRAARLLAVDDPEPGAGAGAGGARRTRAARRSHPPPTLTTEPRLTRP